MKITKIVQYPHSSDEIGSSNVPAILPYIEDTVTMTRYLKGKVIDTQKITALSLQTGEPLTVCERVLRETKGNWFRACKELQ